MCSSSISSCNLSFSPRYSNDSYHNIFKNTRNSISNRTWDSNSSLLNTNSISPINPSVVSSLNIVFTNGIFNSSVSSSNLSVAYYRFTCTSISIARTISKAMEIPTKMDTITIPMYTIFLISCSFSFDSSAPKVQCMQYNAQNHCSRNLQRMAFQNGKKTSFPHNASKQHQRKY